MVPQSHRHDEGPPNGTDSHHLLVARNILAGLLIAVLLAGCTASWRAPVESRGSKSASSDTRSTRVTRSTERYRVRRGDTLYQIAWQRGVDYRTVARWNGIRPPYRIYEGQTLRLTPPSASRQAQKPKKTSSASSASVAKRTKSPAKSSSSGKAKTTPPKTKPQAKKSVSAKDSVSRNLAWRWPVQGPVVSTFNARDEARKGIKIRGRDGAEIRAAEAGKVVYSGSGLIGYGRLIIVKHNDNYLSAYGHNKKILVAEADRVTKGQKIAEMGIANDGRALLHFEIRRNGKPVDPMGLLPRK